MSDGKSLYSTELSKVSLEEAVRPLKIAFSTVSPIGGKVSKSAIAATKRLLEH